MKNTKQTLKAVKAVLAINSISIHKIAGEYKVYPKGTIGQAYFTDDIMDALGTGLEMARSAGTLVGPDGRRTVWIRAMEAAVAYHSTAVVKPTQSMESDGGATLKVAGRTFKVKANRYGNWYGYQGSTRVTMFFGDYVDQMFEAAAWLNTLSQAAVLATLTH